MENKRFVVSTWSILHGHDQWIYTLQWKHFEKGFTTLFFLFINTSKILKLHCNDISESKEEEKLKLLSVSADKTAVIWNRDFAANTWVEQYRLGDLGGNLSGFVGGRFDPTGKYVMANDLLGAFHVWKFDVNILALMSSLFCVAFILFNASRNLLTAGLQKCYQVVTLTK